MANPNNAKNTLKQAVVAPVTPEVTPVVEVAQPRLFNITVEDAPAKSALPEAVKLNPKTLAEQAAGKEAISQYS